MTRIENTPDGEKEHPRSIASIRRTNTSDIRDNDGLDSKRKENHPTSIANLCPQSSSASKISLICSWRAILGQEVIHGEHYLRGIPIRPLTFFRGCPITAIVDHEVSPILHDFTSGPVLVPLRVTLKNRMLESSVKFIVSWEPVSTFELIGTTEQILELQANEEITIPYEALISKAGVHNLQKLRFVIQPHGQQQQHKEQQWLIHLIDSSSAEKNQ